MPEKKQKKPGEVNLVELPTDAPGVNHVTLGARAIAAVTNRLYGSF